MGRANLGGDCDRCDGMGSAFTYANQMLMPLKGRVQGIDWCIGHIVAAPNAGNVPTVTSCCGHDSMPGIIELEDGRVLAIFEDRSAADAQDVWHAFEQ